jgi:hypothetical protein
VGVIVKFSGFRAETARITIWGGPIHLIDDFASMDVGAHPLPSSLTASPELGAVTPQVVHDPPDAARRGNSHAPLPTRLGFLAGVVALAIARYPRVSPR